MSGIVMMGIGIGLVGVSVLLFIASLVYRQTAGKKMKEELKKEYE